MASGLLYAIDPESDAVALLRAGDVQDTSDAAHADASGFCVQIVLAHAVDDLEASAEAPDGMETLEALRESLGGEQETPERQTQRQEEEARRRGERLQRFLAQRFVPFETAADGSVRVFGGAAALPPPFRAVQCANEQLLRRLQALLADFEQQEAGGTQQQAQEQQGQEQQGQGEGEGEGEAGAGGIGP